MDTFRSFVVLGLLVFLGQIAPLWAQTPQPSTPTQESRVRPKVVGENFPPLDVLDSDGKTLDISKQLNGQFSLVFFVNPRVLEMSEVTSYTLNLEPYLKKLGFKMYAILPYTQAEFVERFMDRVPDAVTQTIPYFDPQRDSFTRMGLMDTPHSDHIIAAMYIVGPDRRIRYSVAAVDGRTPLSGEQIVLAAKMTRDFYTQRARSMGYDLPLSQIQYESSQDLLQPLPPPDQSLLRLLMEDDLAHADSYWMQFGLGGSLYNARSNKIDGRWSPGFQFGKRYGRFGYFGNLELDYVFDFTQEVKRLDMVQIGVGIEHLALWGHIRSSLSVGASVLNSDTDIDKRGKTGLYLDFRPISIRRKWDRNKTIEFTPLAIDAAAPVMEGIPLIVFHYFTLISMEWAEI